MATDRISAFRFGRFTLDLDRGALRDGDGDVKLRPQSFKVLRILVENNGRLVSKNQLHERVWKNAVVTDDSITHCLIDIRKAVDDADKKLIRTIPRRGYIFDAPVEVSGTTPKSVGAVSKSPALARVAFAFAVVAAAAAALWFANKPPVIESATELTRVEPPENSIAVLPFIDLSDEQDLQYFGESLSEEVINLLSQSPRLHVIARTSSFSFRGTDADVRTIARRLNIRYILEGSVRQADEKIRVVAQFIDTQDDRHLWSRPFDSSLRGVVDIQSDIAFAVADALQIELSNAVPLSRSTDPTTFNLFGHARHLINILEWDQLPVAIDLLKQALERDPAFVRGMTELGRAYYQQRLTDQVTWDEALENGWRETDRALQLAPGDAVGNAWVGWRELFHHRNYQESARRYRRAFAADPRNVDIIRGAVPVLMTIGRLDDAVELAEYLVAHDPLCIICQQFMVRAYVTARRYEEAEKHLRSLIPLYPERIDFLDMLVGTLMQQGMSDQALATIRDRELDSNSALLVKLISHYRLGQANDYEAAFSELLVERRNAHPLLLTMAYSETGNADAAFRLLEQFYAGENFLSGDFRDPLLAPLHDDPRWSQFLETYRLTDEHFAAFDLSIEVPN